MKVAVIGTGYVGLVTGTCLAHCGHTVTCLDTITEKIEMLRRGKMPLHEPGLEELVAQNVAAKRLDFTTRQAIIRSVDIVMICVGTPQGPTGAADLTALMTALADIAPHLQPDCLVLIKSTVPVGTNTRVRHRLAELTGRHMEVISNPEFLRQGSAVEDFMKPDRVVAGVCREDAAAVVRELYEPVLRHGAAFLVMTPQSAELTKYASNTMLALKIAFINEVATLCDSVGADVDQVRHAVGTDRRIGMDFLCPGPGYGGSCFPKDVRALLATSRENQHELPLIGAIDASNENRKLMLARKVEAHFGDLEGHTIAVWGLAFKPNTDDIREAPALPLIRRLLELGAAVQVHDPQAMNNTRRVFGDALYYASTPGEALAQASALVIVTDWDDYREFLPEVICQSMTVPIVFDGRNLFDPATMAQAGIDYYPTGRPSCSRTPLAGVLTNGNGHANGNGHGRLKGSSAPWHDSSQPLPPRAVTAVRAHVRHAR